MWKKIDTMIADYKKIDKKLLLTINGALIWKTWLFSYPKWFISLQSTLLANKVNKQYIQIQAEIARLERIKNNIN
jgi:hypothetical protein